MSSRPSSVDSGLPVRLSARKGDVCYDERAHKLSGEIDVILDGATLAEVASYDVNRGQVTRHCRDAQGKLILGARGVPTFETLKGKVEVRWVRPGGGAG